MNMLAFNLEPPHLELPPHTLGVMSIVVTRPMMAHGLWLARLGTERERYGRIVYGMDAPPTWREVFAYDGDGRLRMLASWARSRIARLFGRRPRMVTGLLVRSIRIGRLEHLDVGRPCHAEMFGVDHEYGPALRWPIREGERVYIELLNDSNKRIRVAGTVFGVSWVDISPSPNTTDDPTIRKILADMAELNQRLKGKS